MRYGKLTISKGVIAVFLVLSGFSVPFRLLLAYRLSAPSLCIAVIVQFLYGTRVIVKSCAWYCGFCALFHRGCACCGCGCTVRNLPYFPPNCLLFWLLPYALYQRLYTLIRMDFKKVLGMSNTTKAISPPIVFSPSSSSLVFATSMIE